MTSLTDFVQVRCLLLGKINSKGIPARFALDAARELFSFFHAYDEQVHTCNDTESNIFSFPRTTRRTEPRCWSLGECKAKVKCLRVREWCGRTDLNRHRPCGPTDFRTTSAFAAARLARSWSGLSLHHCVAALGAARLVSTPSPNASGLGSGLPLQGFPEFEQFYSADFPPGTQFRLSPVRLPFRHARVAYLYSSHHKARWNDYATSAECGFHAAPGFLALPSSLVLAA